MCPLCVCQVQRDISSFVHSSGWQPSLLPLSSSFSWHSLTVFEPSLKLPSRAASATASVSALAPRALLSCLHPLVLRPSSFVLSPVVYFYCCLWLFIIICIEMSKSKASSWSCEGLSIVTMLLVRVSFSSCCRCSYQLVVVFSPSPKFFSFFFFHISRAAL